MALPFFFVDNLDQPDERLVLSEDTSKHITQVLRMKVGEELLLTDGKGNQAKGIIEDDHRKRCEVKLIAREKTEMLQPPVAIAISLIKNSARFEWFLEKATELGVREIIPLICERTEKEKFRPDRLHNILVSAMLQSQQSWLPVLHQPVSFEEAIQPDFLKQYPRRFIAHCLPEQKLQLATLNTQEASLILIGPEGDFTPAEIEAAIKNSFQPVALGNTRLRTETAGMVAAALLLAGRNGND